MLLRKRIILATSENMIMQLYLLYFCNTNPNSTHLKTRFNQLLVHETIMDHKPRFRTTQLKNILTG